MSLPDDNGARYALSNLRRAIHDHAAGRPYEEPADLIAAVDAVRAIIQTQDAALGKSERMIAGALERFEALNKRAEKQELRQKELTAELQDQEQDIADLGRKLDSVRRRLDT